MGSIYSLGDFGGMISDPTREAWIRALQQSVCEGDIVIDLGAGPGFFAVLAAKLGASRVYAVDPNPVVELTALLAEANGVGDRVTIVQDLSTRFTPPERANVIIADVHGRLPFFAAGIQTLADARERLLAPGGRLIPQRDRVFAAPVCAPRAWEDHFGVWAPHETGVDLSVLEPRVQRMMISASVTPDALLAPAAEWATLDYLEGASPSADGTVSFLVERDGLAHGLLAWFECETAPGISFSTGPANPGSVYGTGLIAFPSPCQLKTGDRVEARLRAVYAGDGYAFSSETTLPDGTVLRQTSLLDALATPSALRRESSAFTPTLDADGVLAKIALGAMDGRRSQGQIARLLASHSPDRFPRWEDALPMVTAIARAYAQRGDG